MFLSFQNLYETMTKRIEEFAVTKNYSEKGWLVREYQIFLDANHFYEIVTYQNKKRKYLTLMLEIDKN